MNQREFNNEYMSTFSNEPVMPIYEEDIHETLSKIETSNSYDPHSYMDNIAVLYFVIQRTLAICNRDTVDGVIFSILCNDRKDIEQFKQVTIAIFTHLGFDGHYNKGQLVFDVGTIPVRIDIDYKPRVAGGILGSFTYDSVYVVLCFTALETCSFYSNMWFINDTTNMCGQVDDVFYGGII